MAFNTPICGTYSTGFRAPTLVENSTDMKNAFVSFRDPERCNDTFKVDCTAQSPYQSGANPKLQPETARSMTLGVVWEPTTWLNVSVDAWRIARDNEVGSYDLATVLSNPARYAGDPAITITRARGSCIGRARARWPPDTLSCCSYTQGFGFDRSQFCERLISDLSRTL